ncbi:hypothetical protein Tco_0178692 [Tanacetum coccineum]
MARRKSAIYQGAFIIIVMKDKESNGSGLARRTNRSIILLENRILVFNWDNRRLEAIGSRNRRSLISNTASGSNTLQVFLRISVNATPTVRIVLNNEKQIWKPKEKLSDNSLNKTKQIWKQKSKLSDNSLYKTKRVWKAMGKLFADIGYQWRPTGKKLTLGKLDCGSQWRPTGKKFALGEMCHLTKLSVKCVAYFHQKVLSEKSSNKNAVVEKDVIVHGGSSTTDPYILPSIWCYVLSYDMIAKSRKISMPQAELGRFCWVCSLQEGYRIYNNENSSIYGNNSRHIRMQMHQSMAPVRSVQDPRPIIE